MIINETKNVTLAEKVITASTIFKRMKGLLGLDKLGAQYAMVIKPCNSIHTFFMRFPIDVLFLGKDKKVIKAITNMPPFRVSPIYIKSLLVVELPAGVIESTATSVGDQLSIL